MKLKKLLVCILMTSLGGVAYAGPGSVSIEKFKKQPLAFCATRQSKSNLFLTRKCVSRRVWSIRQRLISN